MRFYKRIFSYFYQERGYGFVLVFFILLSVALNLLGPYPMGIFLDFMTKQTPKENWIYRALVGILPNTWLGKVICLSGLMACIRISQGLVMLGRNMIRSKMRYNGTSRVRQDLEQKLQLLGTSYHQTHTQGDSLYRLSTDSWGFFDVLDVFIGSTVALVSFLWTLLTIWMIDVKLTFIALGILPGLMLTYRFFGGRIRNRALQSKRLDSLLFTTMQRILGAIPLIQAFRRQQKESLLFQKKNKQSMDAHMSLDWQENGYPVVIEWVLAMGSAVIFVYGAYQVYQGTLTKNQAAYISIGQLTIFLSYLPQFFDTVTWILGFPTKVKASTVACERVFRVLDEPISPVSYYTASALPVQPRTLAFENVQFSYEPNSLLLDGINLQILPGQMVALIGASGTGKSTLLQLLLRFIDPIQGRLTLDGMDFRSIGLEDLRRHMALVPQDASLFPGTLFENITYGNEDATLAEVEEISRKAGIEEFIESLPQKYQTFILEGSRNLSGGQRQRIALARALLTQSPILILDEPTSALDPVQRGIVLETLQTLKGEKTMVISTHDLELIKACDQVFFLHQGTMVSEKNYRVLGSLP